MSEELKHIRLSIGGMSCAACVAAVENILKNFPGVSEATVNFAQHTALVAGDMAVEPLIRAVQEGGYDAAELTSLEEEQAEREAHDHQRYNRLLRQAGVAALVGVPLMAGAMAGLLPPLETGRGQLFWLAIGLVTLAVMIYSGGHFYRGAWRQLKYRNANMDTLIALGTGAAWLYSMAIAFAPEAVPGLARHAYFESAIFILAFINFGQAMELHVRGKTSAAIKRLMGLQAKSVRVVRGGQELDIDLIKLEPGETVRVRPGERIPVDGVIIEGYSHIDESMISGEPLPVARGTDDEVIGGTLNGQGTFLFQAQRIGKDTVLAHIIEAVREAQGQKPQIGRLVDRISAVFVPVVLVIAILAFFAWYSVGPEPALGYAVVTAITVLVIACPCALGLATPISIMVGVGKAVEYGILTRNGDALQRASSLTTVVLDKTGTVTAGQPTVSDIITLPGVDESKLLGIAAALESGSEHPLATAIISAADEHGLERLPMKDFRAIPGTGIEGVIEEFTVYLGNLALMEERGIAMDDLAEQGRALADAGKTPIYVAVGTQAMGIIAISDPIREDSPAAIARLHQLGLKVVMLTGDGYATATAVAAEAGIDQVKAGLLPDEKHAVVARLQTLGEVVCMVGDGINDAPALARADVGIAIGSGSDVAITSADITLIRDSLHGVADAIAVSAATLRNIRQNLIGAFTYNTLGIPLAAGAFYPLLGVLLDPMFAGAAMAASSITVVANASRLRLLRI